MPKITVDDLDRIKAKVRQDLNLRTGVAMVRVTVHMGTCGIAAGAREVMKALMEEIEQQKLEDVMVTTSGCAGLCSREPMATVERAGEAPVKYVDLTAERMREIVREHVIGGRIVTSCVLAVGSEQAY